VRVTVFLIFFFVLNCSTIVGQEFVLLDKNLSLFNPAYTGNNGRYYTSGQTLPYYLKPGYSFYPISSAMLAEYQSKNKRHGFGGIALLNNRNNYHELRLGLNYSYKVYQSKTTMIRLGASLNHSMIKHTISWIPPTSIPDHEEIGTSKYWDSGLNIGFFASYKNLEGGFSLFNYSLLASNNDFQKSDYSFTFSLKYKHKLNEKWELIPYTIVVSDFAHARILTTVKAIYNNKFDFGFAGYIQDGFAIPVGITLKQFHVGYAFVVTTSRLSIGMGNTHEIQLSYNIN